MSDSVDDDDIQRVMRQIGGVVQLMDSASSAHVLEERERHLLLAFAALSRCRSFLLGSEALVTAGRGDITGVTVRALIEFWYVGVIGLLGTEADLGRLEADHRYWRNDLAKSINLETEAGAARTFSIKKRAERANELLVAVGQAAGTATDLCAQFYAAESLTGAHAGFESLKRYVELDDSGNLAIQVEPRPDTALYGRLRIAVIITALLAKLTWEQAGLAGEAFDSIDLEDDAGGPPSCSALWPGGARPAVGSGRP